MEKSNGNSGRVFYAQDAKVTYTQIHAGQLPNEFVVTLKTSKGLVSTILQSNCIDQQNKTINVVVISQDNDQYLVDLSADTFISGSKAWFPKDSVLVHAER